MMRVREARISSSWRLRSVTSMPDRSTSDASRPVTSSIGVAVQAITIVLAVGLAPPRLALDARDAVRRRRDRHPREVAVVGVDQVEHARAHDLLVGPAERLPERVVDPGPVRVDAAVDDHALPVDDDDDARDRLHQRARDVALALQLQLPLLALGHVDAADEEEPALVDRAAGGCTTTSTDSALPALRHPRVVVVADRLAGDRRGRSGSLTSSASSGSDVVLPEHRAARLVRLDLERPLEGLVRARAASRTPSSSIRQRRLGASFAIALRKLALALARLLPPRGAR